MAVHRNIVVVSLVLLALILESIARTSTAATFDAGSFHTCAIDNPGGGMYCWGLGDMGQIGNGQLLSRAAPTRVTSTVSHWRRVGSGERHSCGLSTSGGVYCWGRNTYGQLGEGTTSNRSRPFGVVGLSSGVTALAVGHSHTCALLETGRVNCWGFGGDGRLGTGNSGNQSTPAEVTGLDNVVAIAAGGLHTCAALADGSMKCWGDNAYGQIGDGSTTDRPAPVFVAIVSDVQEIDLGMYHSCARNGSGGLACWGRNHVGQVGDGTLTNRTRPVYVSGLASGTRRFAVGEYHACASDANEVVKCWGWNSRGQLGNSTLVNSSVPTDITPLPFTARELTAGQAHTCARGDGNAVQCWGEAEDGRTAFGTTAVTYSSRPRPISGLRAPPLVLSARTATVCAVTAAASASCWGANDMGQLGESSTVNSSGPREVTGLQSGVSDIGAGDKHACAIRSNGTAWCWGANADGQIGDATNIQRFSRVQVIGIGDAVQIETGLAFSCARTAAGGVWCWGNNSYGQLGNGTASNSNQPITVSGLASGVAALSLGHQHACALKTDGSVVCWGRNSTGQLGIGTTANANVPTPILDAFARYTAIVAGASHSCGLTTAGQVKCWGYNAYGQLGDGSTMTRTNPAPVAGLANGVTLLAAGDHHSCALRAAVLQCWGRNNRYQLGDGALVNRLTPVVALNVPAGVRSLALGTEYSCATFADDIGRCWGNNQTGQGGNGAIATDFAIPEPISQWPRDDRIFQDGFGS